MHLKDSQVAKVRMMMAKKSSTTSSTKWPRKVTRDKRRLEISHSHQELEELQDLKMMRRCLILKRRNCLPTG